MQHQQTRKQTDINKKSIDLPLEHDTGIKLFLDDFSHTWPYEKNVGKKKGRLKNQILKFSI